MAQYYDHDGTTEAFSFLRFVHAKGHEIVYLPRMGADYDLVRRPIEPLSLDNELDVLKHIAALCAQQLSKYAMTLEVSRGCVRVLVPCRTNGRYTKLVTTFNPPGNSAHGAVQEDVDLLKSGSLEMGSNRRNAVVLLKGEKELCRFYIELHRVVAELAALPVRVVRRAQLMSHVACCAALMTVRHSRLFTLPPRCSGPTPKLALPHGTAPRRTSTSMFATLPRACCSAGTTTRLPLRCLALPVRSCGRWSACS